MARKNVYSDDQMQWQVPDIRITAKVIANAPIIATAPFQRLSELASLMGYHLCAFAKSGTFCANNDVVQPRRKIVSRKKPAMIPGT